jgi:hypothetical protein
VTGTPGSGKTTLMHLLHSVIIENRPNARVFVINGWSSSELQHLDSLKDCWSKKIDGWDGYRKDDFYLIDEGHTSYWDQSLWKDFKDQFQRTSVANAPHVVLFCNYYEDLHKPYGIVPPSLGDGKLTLARIMLPPNNDKYTTPVGLLLDWKEYVGVLDRFTSNRLLLDDELKHFIFEFTAGHIGAVRAMFAYLIKTVRCLIPYCTLFLTSFQGGTHHDQRKNRHFCRISEKGPYISEIIFTPNRGLHLIPFVLQ